ncbi:MAG: bifunctional hydroxymethylpyrimidine kinase/phosphomethylpyrimidine kinase [Alphaproteobacteria bacterium]|nr:bifunctional hydroxymethylpyrimidine kinase/phosphomethylpyrimidine kinase [Alphaproteobacteria bacterium]|tara:strand:- start:7905 stop:8699 length:795 start_codon:yes stop_codon:yes gene_type:complete
MNGRVLVIAGSDSGGGAGIQADIKTITTLGGYAATAITALTAQNTLGISSVHVIPAKFVADQICVVIKDIGADCIKTGMLQNAEIINSVADVLGKISREIPIVVDPVMVSKSGVFLLEKSAQAALVKELFPMLTLITPNIPEAEVLCGKRISSVNDMYIAGREIRRSGARAVLVKGGHLDGDVLSDVLICDDGEFIFHNKRINSSNTHGTGCTLSSAIAVGISQGIPLQESIKRARDYLYEAISEAPGFGSGYGPVNHSVTIRK